MLKNEVIISSTNQVQVQRSRKQTSLALGLIQDEYAVQEVRWILGFLIPMFLSLFTGLTVGIVTTFLATYLRAKIG